MPLSTSHGVYQRKLQAFFDDTLIRFTPFTKKQCSTGLVWGRKKSGQGIAHYCKAKSLPLLHIEDGFIAYLSHPSQSKQLLSLAIDDRGIYYDARTPSQLEHLICSKTENSARAETLISRLRDNNIGKYNLVTLTHPTHFSPADVIVVDQTLGDLSIEYSLATAQSFQTMLHTARQENPDKRIAIKTHPDVILGKKRGHFNPHNTKDVTFISETVEPSTLFANKPKVYTVCSLLGFEALLHGCEVSTFGVPFYAGWGLTTHHGQAIARRNSTKSLAQLVEAAYIDYCRYVHPDTQERCEVEAIIDYIVLQRRPLSQYSQVACPPPSLKGYSLWKRSFLPYFLQSIPSTAQQSLSKTSSTYLQWGAKQSPSSNTIQIEDGFIRSAGLGADLKKPNSLVIDAQGIYFDPTMPSDLETILQHQTLTSKQIERSRELIAQLINSKVSKYNIEGSELSAAISEQGHVLLVVGQVEDDASIQRGSVSIKTNLALLRAVRQQHPNAFIIYKPHPDVESGNRKGKIDDDTVKTLAELNGRSIDILELIDKADAVHTITSLTGFEAIIRNKKVVCWGQPFYCGWGLTEDKHPVARRQRQLSKEELVYGALVDYPVYINWHTRAFTTPEFVIKQLSQERGQQTAGSAALIRKAAFLIDTLRLLFKQ